jgi:hypothetical protein
LFLVKEEKKHPGRGEEELGAGNEVKRLKAAWRRQC